MEKPIVRRKQIDPALIEKVCNSKSNNANIGNLNTPSTNPDLYTIRPTTPNNADASSLPGSWPSSTSTSHLDGPSSPNSSIISSPTVKPSSIRSGKPYFSPPSHLESSPSTNTPPSKESKPQSSTKQKARKWLQGTKAFLEGIKYPTENEEEEDQYFYIDKRYKGYLDKVCPFPPPPDPPILESTPPLSQIFQKHHDLQLMYKVLRSRRDDLYEEIKKLKTGTIADLKKEVEKLKLELKKEKEEHHKTIQHYESRIRGWINRYDFLFNKWAKLENLDPIFYYDEKEREDPVGRAALKCHAFEKEIQSLLQRLTHAVKKQPLDPKHPVQNPTLPKVPQNEQTILTDTFLSAFKENNNNTNSTSQQMSDGPKPAESEHIPESDQPIESDPAPVEKNPLEKLTVIAETDEEQPSPTKPPVTSSTTKPNEPLSSNELSSVSKVTSPIAETELPSSNASQSKNVDTLSLDVSPADQVNHTPPSETQATKQSDNISPVSSLKKKGIQISTIPPHSDAGLGLDSDILDLIDTL